MWRLLVTFSVSLGVGCELAGNIGNRPCQPEPDQVLCARQGRTCGSLSSLDNCGAFRTVGSCGTCESPATCGGNGLAGECGPGSASGGGSSGGGSAGGGLAGGAAGALGGAGIDREWSQTVAPPDAPVAYTVGTATVTDGVTGLMWQREEAGSFGWDEARTFCTRLTLEGHSDWRLPTRIELVSIVDTSRFAPAINLTAFPPTTQRFWTSTPSALANLRGESRIVEFQRGGTYSSRQLNVEHVRCVRAGITTPAAAPLTRYIVEAETVFDSVTGLMWQRNVSGRGYSWSEASTLCQTLRAGGFSNGWRLPRRKELETLIDEKQSTGPTLATFAFPTDQASGFFWSSTPGAASLGSAWQVSFSLGQAFAAQMSAQFQVRCVR